MSTDGSPTRSPQITQILRRLASGEASAADALLPLVYEELRDLARSRLAKLRSQETLQATALVHEAWIRLGGREAAQWESRAHFYGAAAQAMRRILVEQYRNRNREKRGGGMERQELETRLEAPARTGLETDLLALDEALSRLGGEHERAARVVSLRYFAGLTMDDIAELLEISPRTAHRDWQFARSWLRRELT